MTEKMDRIIGGIAEAIEIASMIALLPTLAFFIYISL